MKGFTLLEVLLTLLLVVSGFTALSYAISTGLFVSGASETSLIATELAHEKMEQIQNTSYGSIANESRTAVSGFPSFEREVTVSTPLANLKQVTVNVYWFNKDDELKVDLVTYVANP